MTRLADLLIVAFILALAWTAAALGCLDDAADFFERAGR